MSSSAAKPNRSLPKRRESADQHLADVSNQLPAKRHCSSQQLHVQKVFALVIFERSVTVDKVSILDATRVACKFSGFSAEVIRRWAMNVFTDFLKASLVLRMYSRTPL